MHQLQRITHEFCRIKRSNIDGIDNDLSGLEGLTGVTTISRGTGNSQQTVYDIGTSRLIIEGTLNHNPDIELLISHNGINDNSFGVITVTGTGTYNFGQRILEMELLSILTFRHSRKK